jgi:hypothetical protein
MTPKELEESYLENVRELLRDAENRPTFFREVMGYVEGDDAFEDREGLIETNENFETEASEEESAMAYSRLLDLIGVTVLDDFNDDETDWPSKCVKLELLNEAYGEAALVDAEVEVLDEEAFEDWLSENGLEWTTGIAEAILNARPEFVDEMRDETVRVGRLYA